MELDRKDLFSVNSLYSTTRLVTSNKPVIKNTIDDKFESFLFLPKGQKADGGLRKQGYFKGSHSEFPLVSILTIVYNGENYLEQTIKSVIEQTYSNIEYIIIDGNSNDGTLDIIKKYEDCIDYWISGGDDGISDAMNKGLSLSSGEYIVFIHSDDYLINSTCVEEVITQREGYDIIICDVLFGSESKRLVSREFNFWMNFKIGICHQGAICKRSVFYCVGVFDRVFKITMDYDLFLRAYHHGLSVKKVPIILSMMRDTGISSKQDWTSLLQRFNEEKKVHYKNCSSNLMYCCYFLYWFLYPKYRLIKQVLKW